MAVNSQPTVLVVEPDSHLAKLVCKRLADSGCDVHLANSASLALDAVQKQRIDLILLDHLLPPGVDGVAFHDWLKTCGYDIPVILVTQSSDESTVIRSTRNDVRDFVSRSIEYLDYLPEAVHRVLEQVRTEQQLAESESRLAGVIASANDAIITTTAAGKITLFNPAAELMFRSTAADAMTRHLGRFIPKEYRPFPGRGESDGRVSASSLVRDGRWGLRADNEWFPLEASMSSAEVRGERVNTIVVRDVTERYRSQIYIAAQLETARVIAGAITVEDAIPKILAAVARPLGWSVGGFWLLQKQSPAPMPLGFWHDDEFDGQPFLEQTRALLTSDNASLPGKAWESGRPEWINNLAESPTFLRRETAVQAGLRAGYAFPIFIEGQVVGVMEYYSATFVEPDHGLLSLMVTIGSQVGQFIARQRTEQAIRRTAQELATAQKIARMGSWRLILATNTVTWSDELYRIFALELGEPVGPWERVLERIPASDRDRVRLGMATSLRTGQDYDCHHGVIQPGGEIRSVHARGSLVRDEHGTVLEMVGTVQDVTEAVRADEQLRDQAALLDKARDAIIVEALNDTILYWNRSAERLYGRTAQEVIGRRTTDLLLGDFQLQRDEVRRSLAEVGEWSGEFRQLAKDGRELVVESSWTLLRDAQGQPKAKLVIMTDVTEKRRLEVQYFRVQRLDSLGALASGIAHDLNNVLTPINMTLDFLKTPMPDDQRQGILDLMRASVERGIGLVQQVLSISRGIEGHRVPVPPRDVVADLEKLVRQTFPKNVYLQMTVPADVWSIRGDAAQLHQVLMNLCVNARDAMPAGGRLTVGVENISCDALNPVYRDRAKARSYVRLWVADTGTGISPAILEKIFDPFFTTKGPGHGVGLGLSTAMGIVKSHAGFLDVESQVGEGTVFSAYFPAINSDSIEHSQAMTGPPRGADELILIVDDEASIRQMMSAMLEVNGYRVVIASGGAEALELYNVHRKTIRAIVTDLMMPSMDGTATIQALREQNRHVPIIAVSGCLDPHLNIKPANVQAVLQKPFTKAQLLTTLSRVLYTAVPRLDSPGPSRTHEVLT